MKTKLAIFICSTIFKLDAIYYKNIPGKILGNVSDSFHEVRKLNLRMNKFLVIILSLYF